MKNITYIVLVSLLLITKLSATEQLDMAEVGNIKNVSSSCTGSTCEITLDVGSKLYYSITNNTNKNLVLSKFEIIRTYNGSSVVETSTTDKTVLGDSYLAPNQTISLGYTLVNATLGNYWTGKYYISDTTTGEKFTNSLRWDNDMTSPSVIVENLTETIINVSSTAEFRSALTTAATNGKDTIIHLADGTYRTTDDSQGTFTYSSSQDNKLIIEGSTAQTVVLSGEDTDRVLYLYNTNDTTSFHLKNISVERGKSDGDGGGVWSNINTYVDSCIVQNNNAGFSYTGGGLSIDNSYKANLWLSNSLIENNTGQSGGGFKTWNAEVKNCTIKGNTARLGAGGFYAPYAQVYNSILIENNATSSSGNGGAFHTHFSLSLVNSLVMHNSTGVTMYSGDSNYIVNTIFKDNGEFALKSTGSSSATIENSYLDDNLSISNFQTNVISSGDLGFVDEVKGDYTLVGMSVLIDAGTASSSGVILPITDLNGNVRIAGGSVDIGPYEFSTTSPTIYDLSYTGILKAFETLTFSVNYDLNSGRTLDYISYDYLNDGSWTSINTHTFNTPGTYTIEAKVTDSSGEFSIKTLVITIAPLAFADMTDEQKLIKAIDPQHYDEIIAIIAAKEDIANATGETIGENKVVSSPSTYGLYSESDLNSSVATATDAGVTAGKNMIINSPSAYGLVSTSDLNTSVSEALISGVASGKQYVKDNLSEFGLVTKSSIELTATNVSALSTGWTLVSTPFSITDMSIFDSALIIWVYSNSTASWSAYSSNTTTKQKIIDKADVSLISIVPAGSGIWIKK